MRNLVTFSKKTGNSDFCSRSKRLKSYLYCSHFLEKIVAGNCWGSPINMSLLQPFFNYLNK